MQKLSLGMPVKLYKHVVKNALLIMVLLFMSVNSYAQCSAGFTYSVSGRKVTFTNTSTTASGNALKYFWNFGNSHNNYSAKDTVWYYYSDTDYVVTLSIYDSVASCTDVYTDTIHFKYYPPCEATWSYNIIDLYKSIEIKFLVNSSDNYKTYTWSFGDGTSATGPEKTHIYSSYGTYNVCLIIADSSISCFDTICKQVTVAQPNNIDSCYARIESTSNSNGDIKFYAHATCRKWDVTSYYWDFGDGDTSTNANPTHKYLKDGTYKVQLLVTGNGSAIPDTAIMYLNYTYNCHQLGYSDYSYNNAYDVKLKLNATPGSTFELDFGDGTKYTTLTIDSVFKHTYAAKGPFTIKLNMEDTSNACKKSFIFNVHANPLWCYAGFKMQSVNDSTISVYSDSTYSGRDSSVFVWNFGDGTKDSAIGKWSTHHIYKNSGLYRISLKTLNSKYSCSDTSSIVIKIDKKVAPVNRGYIYGIVNITTTELADSAVVYLIKYDASAGTLIAVDSIYVTDDTLNRNTSFRFDSLTAGNYYVKAALAKNSKYYQIFFPTYFEHSLKWANANAVTISNNSHAYVHISLRTGTNPGGPGFISGSVTAGANKKEGDPLQDIQVMLFDAQNNPVTYTYSDAEGKFKFENLALGTYEIYTEVIGLQTNSGFVTLTQNAPVVNDVTVKVSKTGITTGIYSYSSNNFIAQPRLYPNPATNLLYLELNLNKPQKTGIYIYNITGQLVYSESVNIEQGIQVQQININSLPAGAYMLSIKNASGENQMNAKIIKY